LPIISSWLYNVTYGSEGEKLDPERVRAAIEAVRNKEMDSYKASRLFNVPQKTQQRYVKDRQNSAGEAIKTKFGRKQVLPCEERKCFGLTMENLMRLAYQPVVRNRIKRSSATERKRLERSG
jgi:hypothetical protein